MASVTWHFHAAILMIDHQCLVIDYMCDCAHAAACSDYEVTIYYAHIYLKLLKVFNNSQTEHDMEVRFTSIDFSRKGTEGFRSTWLQTLDNQLINHSHTLILTANVTCFIIFLECAKM